MIGNDNGIRMCNIMALYSKFNFNTGISKLIIVFKYQNFSFDTCT